MSIDLAWSESVHGFDTGRVPEYVLWIQTPEREQLGQHIGTIPLRFVAFWIIQVIGIGLRAMSR